MTLKSRTLYCANIRIVVIFTGRLVQILATTFSARDQKHLPSRSVRKEEDAKRLQAECGESFSALKFDVTDEEAVQKAAAKVAIYMDGHCLLALVNNAGQRFRSGFASLFASSFTLRSEGDPCVQYVNATDEDLAALPVRSM